MLCGAGKGATDVLALFSLAASAAVLALGLLAG